MDKELKKAIAEKYRVTFVFLCSLEGWNTTDMVPEGILKEAMGCEKTFTESVLTLIEEAGYRKVSELPLLSDEEIDRAIFSVLTEKRQSLKHWIAGSPELVAIAQAQVDKIKKWLMEGK